MREPIPSDLRAAVMLRDRGRCVVCGSTDDLQIDHVHAVTRGGDNRIENLQTLCRSCNSSKKGKDSHEWLASGAWSERDRQSAQSVNDVAELAALWPSFTEFAKDAGVGFGTAHQWRLRNRIKVDYWPAIIDGARRRGIEGVSADRLMEIASDRSAA